MADVLREFLVSIGFSTDTGSARRAEAEAKRVERAVVNADKGMTAQSNVGAAARIIAANREAGVRTRGAADLIRDMKRIDQQTAKTTTVTVTSAKDREQADIRATRAARERSGAITLGLAAMATAAVAAGVRVAEAVTRVAGNMDQLYQASQRTKASAGNLKAFGYAASQLGGSVEGAMGSLEALAGKMRASPGYESMLNSLGVSTRENGELRDTVNVVEDLGKAFAKMPHFQALAYANALGIDERTMSALKSGEFAKRAAEYRDMLAQAKLDPKQAAKDSADFMQVFRRMQNGLEIVGMRIESALVKQFGGSVNKFTDWLLNNSDRIASAFAKIGEYLLRFVDHLASLFKAFDNLDPKTKDFLIKLGALAGALVLLNSGPLGALVAITAALVAFLDEDKLKKLGEMWEKFDALAKKLTGQDGLVLAFEALGAVMLLRVLAPLTKITGLMAGLIGLSMPAWLLALLGIAGVGAGAAAANQLPKVLGREGAAGVDPSTGGATDRSVTDGLIEPGQEGGGQRWLREKWGAAKRALGLGGREGVYARADRSRRQTEAAGGGRQFSEASPTEAAGKYRPVYTPGDADLSQRTADVIAGEAIRRNPQSIDAVINNMMNRVGSKGWGPSKNLLEVATAPGQYEASWKGSKASPAETEYIRSRIRAIASGGVPDNTNGSNAFRASGYRGPWYYRHGVNGAVVGGNRFAYEPNAPNGPYAPYKTPRPDSPAMTAIPKLENALQNFSDRWGAGAPQPFQGRPLGTWTTSSVNTTNNIRIESPTSVSVSGVGDAKAVGSEVGKTQSRVHADLLRNLQGAVA